MEILFNFVLAIIIFCIFYYFISKVNNESNEENYIELKHIPHLYPITIDEHKNIKNEETIIIRFDEENNILISNNANLLKDDIIRIIKEVAKLKTID